MSEADGIAKRPDPHLTDTQLDSGAPSSSGAGAPVNTPINGWASSGTGSATATEARFIGAYRLIRKLGEGGMGQVWLAEQTAPVKRTVALKLIKVGMYDDDVLRRFEAERQSLAVMDHPAIAKVFDAGSTPDRQPYFVMEYVAGIPINEYCDQMRLTVRQRLELFIKVCEGVQHAHQKAIIHRDLKPANILVTEVDGKPVPRIIDFGLAKAITPELGNETSFTRVGAFVGTPGYMSPEQGEPNAQDVDTRTDVYSLGAVLYILLTGAEPFDSGTWHKTSLYEVLRQLREREPPTPSAKVRAANVVSSRAGLFGMQPKQLEMTLRGDLDCITMKSLERDRARRYSTPVELAADIGRYLNDQPIVARPASAAYRVKKYVQRHRALVVGAAAVFFVLLAGVITSTWQAVVARRAQQAAAKEAASANAVVDFLRNDLLAQASPKNQSGSGAKPDRDIKVRTALDRAAARIEGKFDQQPEVEAAIRDAMGRTYEDLAQYAESQRQLERALDLERRVWGLENPKTLNTLNHLGRTLWHQGKYQEAGALFGPALEIERRVLGPEHPDTLYCMNNLANVYRAEAKNDQAEPLYRQTLEIRRRVLGPEHPDTLSSMNNLANVYWSQGNYAQAEALYRETMDIQRRVLGPEHPSTLLSMGNLADTYTEQGKYVQAEPLFIQTLEISRRVLGPEHTLTLGFLSDFTTLYQRQGQYALAETYAAQVLAGRQRAGSSEDPADIQSAMCNLALIYVSEGKFVEGERLARETLEFDEQSHLDSWERFRAASLLGASLAGQKKYAEAEPLLLQGYQGMSARQQQMGVPYFYHLDRARVWLIQLYQAWGKPENAVAWQKNQEQR